MVFARTDPTVDPKARPSWHFGFHWWERRAGTARRAVYWQHRSRRSAIFAGRRGNLAFDKCRVPAANRIGEERRGFYALPPAGLGTGRGRHTAARSICLAQGRATMQIAFRTRRQFGNAILRRFQRDPVKDCVHGNRDRKAGGR